MTKCPKCGTDNAPENVFCENCRQPLGVTPAAPALDTLSNLQTIGGDQTLPRNAYPLDKNLTLEAGTVFADRYTIISLIGIGGMGVVYRAKDKIGDRDVALKLIRTDRLGGAGAVNRLISEGVLTQDIRHKNIVGVYHVDQCNGQPFIAMEFVQGESLREWHRKHVRSRADVPMRVAARIINEILDGLQVAHEMGVVHRDLKPENIMLTTDPSEDKATLKILDFGIARSDGKAAESGTGTGLGTPRYMAPEQITNPDSAGPAADLYSLSTIFYELLVDVLPQGSWQPPSVGRPDVPPAIDALIQAGLSNRPSNRPQSVAEYREKLNAALGSGDIVVDDKHVVENDRERPSPPKRRNWKLIGGIAGAVIVIGGIGQMLDSGESIPPQIENTITPVPPPPPSPYSKLSGQWLDDTGGSLAVTVNPAGGFSGSGATGQGMAVMIEGGFSGPGGRYAITNGATRYQGELSWDGQCHIAFRTLMPDGSVLVQGKFHVNHPPGAPCPPQ